MDDEDDMVSEQCMVFHIGSYMKMDFLLILLKMQESFI